ncbi:MAG TPA: pyridoxamine 5'-phosphate oxidase family protein [Acidimicrobiales bacterium]|nr:pyridoxamine 5'-phosphate oxidase family protein [Acidimicrobiales bacterium]
MLSAETKDFLESGCALIVATVSSSGEPFATRGWGLFVIDEGRVRLLLDERDERALADLRHGGRVAITAAHVPTLHSLQMKGRFVRSEPADDRDRQKVMDYCDNFFTDIENTDGQPRRLLERLVPEGYVACELVIEEFYDQTPGPGAGASLVQP